MPQFSASDPKQAGSSNTPTERPSWSSQFGFIISSAGSAVGLANIWRFPYITGANGGAAFLILYLVCLALLGLPVFLCEIALGRRSQSQPLQLFRFFSQKKWLKAFGYLPIMNGFLVSGFYSAIAGMILGYLFEALTGRLNGIATLGEASQLYRHLISVPAWSVSYHCLFLILSGGILILGVKEGIERSNRILMPMLLAILVFLNGYAALQPGAVEGLKFLFIPDWNLITSDSFLIALGHAFFTLSLGQGTMLTYGSYLPKKANLIKSCITVALFDTTIALLAGSAIFMFLFSQFFNPDSGPSLLFTTMPVLFSRIDGGYYLTIIFFMLLVFAALTSEVSAIEPVVAYLNEEVKLSRKTSAIIATIAAIITGVPSALSTSTLAGYLVQGKTPFDWISHLTLDILIPTAALMTLWLATFHAGTKTLLTEIEIGDEGWLARFPWLGKLIMVLVTTISPILLCLILLLA
jgi:NSS family neurotransmitter:Na+ symporter